MRWSPPTSLRRERSAARSNPSPTPTFAARVRPAAFVGPAFVSSGHPLAALTGIANGVCLRSRHASLFYSGPGAGPDVTAATLLDDVVEALAGGREQQSWRESIPAAVAAPEDGRWLVRVTGSAGLPRASDTADLLGSHDVWTSRISPTPALDLAPTVGGSSRCRAPSGDSKAAIDSLSHAAGCQATVLPVLGDTDER